MQLHFDVVNPNIKMITCPFTGEALAAIPAHRPDVTFIHAQKASAKGDVLIEGIIGVQKEAALSAKRVVVTVEEVVPSFKGLHPNLTILPRWTIDAIAVVPGGAHPSYTHGYYARDNAAYLEWDKVSADREAFSAWMQATHMHPDHSNGLTADDGTANFTNAELVVSETDVKHWHDDSAMSIATQRHQARFFMGARQQIVPYLDRRRDAAGEVFPGVTAIPLPGHTPGHTGYLVQSGNEQLFIWGDIFHIPDVQVPYPNVHVEPDSDHRQAVATRLRAFDMAATDQLLVAGMHMHFPGFLHMTGTAQKGHQVHSEMWVQSL